MDVGRIQSHASHPRQRAAERLALERLTPPLPPAEIDAAAARLAGLKRALYIDKYVAGLPCAVIYNDYTFGQDFSGAAVVDHSLEHVSLEQLSDL